MNSHDVMKAARRRINLQREGSHAKPYQVRQVREVILKYKLEEAS